VLWKFTGDKMSLEARIQADGKLWKVTLFERGHETTYVDATENEVLELAAQKNLRASPRT
jgi:hypothetical protein